MTGQLINLINHKNHLNNVFHNKSLSSILFAKYLDLLLLLLLLTYHSKSATLK